MIIEEGLRQRLDPELIKEASEMSLEQKLAAVDRAMKRSQSPPAT